MSLKNKALDLASEARNTAGQLTSDLQQSQAFEQAKVTLTNTKDRALAVDTASIKLMNFFAVFSLAFMLLSTFFPVMTFMGSSMPLSELTPSWLYVIVILALCSHLLGAKQLISRSLLLILLVSIGYTLYQQLAEMFQMTQMLGGARTKDIMRGLGEALKYTDIGLYLFLVSLVLVVITTIKPGYKTNHALWAQLVQK
ncbi:hypothetical protein CXF83_02755 [Shewanella sp. Choline-02u-19]|jgi:hypothetical protein|uniref:hypothetical protein n=1 Tax=unclassified Shewanella TaxID=196818 RepID=UPI000C33BF54|nr:MULTISPECIES: hypothetical protein [unclassified Shewanella]PKG56124.1 hypothetical protein CXF82_16575 [Shewanella sp. GutDb-MelDb]PKG72825.1 hypothetical protein CXF86_20695 [Shewanella sp. GutCb]PKH57296.1 hypothetical protein CXF84_10000 [Shewanella sp. Bg11-22]PKI29590.1 hypothetical protein CXF83_02755 [Shewanella sp. Choline-02u-19]